MKFLPLLLSYAGSTQIVLTDTTNVLALSAAALADAIAAVNASPTTYGLGAGAVLPSAPSVPTGALGLAYTSNGESFALVSSTYAHGDSLPNPAADALLNSTNLAALIAANTALKPNITTGPTTKSVAAPNPTTFAVVVSGSGLSYQWQKSTDGGTTWTNITNAGVYTTATTATLNISDVTGLTGTKYRCVVTNNSAQRISSVATLTVT